MGQTIHADPKKRETSLYALSPLVEGLEGEEDNSYAGVKRCLSTMHTTASGHIVLQGVRHCLNRLLSPSGRASVPSGTALCPGAVRWNVQPLKQGRETLNVTFNEAWMGAGEPLKGSLVPGFGAGNRTPETSRVHKHRALSPRPLKAVRKGLARSAVAVVRIDPRKFEVRVKGTRELIGVVKKVQGAGGKGYSYQLRNEPKAHKGFGSQKAAVERMLEKV